VTSDDFDADSTIDIVFPLGPAAPKGAHRHHQPREKRQRAPRSEIPYSSAQADSGRLRAIISTALIGAAATVALRVVAQHEIPHLLIWKADTGALVVIAVVAAAIVAGLFSAGVRPVILIPVVLLIAAFDFASTPAVVAICLFATAKPHPVADPTAQGDV
jgi:hypothetical protein